MLRYRIPLGIALFVAFSCDAKAQSQQYSQPQIESSKLGKDKRPTQPAPTVNFPASQEITEAIAGGIERAEEKRETNHPTPPPDNSGWVFNLFLVIFTGALVVVGIANCYLIFWTLKATEKAADAAKGALIATARPKIIVRKVEAVFLLPPYPPTSARFNIVNVGGSHADLIERNAILAALNQDLMAYPNYLPERAIKDGHMLKCGGCISDSANVPDLTQFPSETQIRSGALILVLYGFVRYRDEAGVVREMGFGRKFDPITKRFHPLNDPEVEYGD